MRGTFYPLTFNQWRVGSIPTRPTSKTHWTAQKRG